MTGIHDMDEYVQAQLVLAALNITRSVLRTGGAFVAKIFRGREIGLLYDQLRVFFEEVVSVKPRSSRASSLEGFVVCRGLREGADGADRQWEDMMIDASSGYPYGKRELAGAERMMVPFVACGDLCGFDSDTAYEMDGTSLPPVAPPLSAPYLKALQQRREEAQKAGGRAEGK